MQAVIYAMIKKDYTTERSREGTAALDDGKRSAAMREVVMNKKTNLLQLEAFLSARGCGRAERIPQSVPVQ